MSISPQMLRSMRDELMKISQQGPYRTAAEQAVVKRPGLMTNIHEGIRSAGQRMERAGAGVAHKLRGGGTLHESIRGAGQGMEGAAAGVVKRVSKGSGIKKRILGAKKKLIEDTAGEAVEGAKKKLMTVGGTPNTQMRQFGREMGSEAAEGVLKKIRPSGKMMALGGAGALAAGGLAAYGMHRARKRRKADIQQAVAEGIRQERSPATMPA